MSWREELRQRVRHWTEEQVTVERDQPLAEATRCEAVVECRKCGHAEKRIVVEVGHDREPCSQCSSTDLVFVGADFKTVKICSKIVFVPRSFDGIGENYCKLPYGHEDDCDAWPEVRKRCPSEYREDGLHQCDSPEGHEGLHFNIVTRKRWPEHKAEKKLCNNEISLGDSSDGFCDQPRGHLGPCEERGVVAEEGHFLWSW